MYVCDVVVKGADIGQVRLPCIHCGRVVSPSDLVILITVVQFGWKMCYYRQIACLCMSQATGGISPEIDSVNRVGSDRKINRLELSEFRIFNTEVGLKARALIN